MYWHHNKTLLTTISLALNLLILLHNGAVVLALGDEVK